jgi:hypothetical protein
MIKINLKEEEEPLNLTKQNPRKIQSIKERLTL